MPSRKKKKFNRSLLVALLVVLISGALFFFILERKKKTLVLRYSEFGIAIPAGYSIHGIDVSRYQQRIAWEEVKAMKVKDISVDFAFIKATEGVSNVDPQFRRNWKKSKETGTIRGAYHFFIASKDGKMQAQNFIKEVKLQPGDLPPVLDIEQRNGVSVKELQKEAMKWLTVVEEYYKLKPIIYTNVDFYNQNLGSGFDSYPLWVAHYYQPYQPRIKRGWHFWQHSDEGRVTGILSKVDFNVFAGDSLEFRNFLVR